MTLQKAVRIPYDATVLAVGPDEVQIDLRDGRLRSFDKRLLCQYTKTGEPLLDWHRLKARDTITLWWQGVVGRTHEGRCEVNLEDGTQLNLPAGTVARCFAPTGGCCMLPAAQSHQCTKRLLLQRLLTRHCAATGTRHRRHRVWP